MAVYSYYYGASPDQGIAVQAQSRELNTLRLGGVLRELASLRALDSSEHSGEMLSYFIRENDHGILGLSYIEPPKSSGYSRHAPCGLEYIIPMKEWGDATEELGRILNFVNFRKPSSASPSPLSSVPLNESGYYYHNSPAVLAPMVDGMLRAALGKEVLLIGLPKGKNSDYATARYTVAEAYTYLPLTVRPRVRFFTGLPVAEGVSDPLAGFENAVRLGANVIFCPNEFFSQLRGRCSCIGLDMDNPSGHPGDFARFVAGEPDVSYALTLVEGNVTAVSYEAFNEAARQVLDGNFRSIDSLTEDLLRTETRCRKLESQVAALKQELRAAGPARPQGGNVPSSRFEDPPLRARGPRFGFVRIMVNILCALALIAATYFGTRMLLEKETGGDNPAPAAAVTSVPAENTQAPDDAGTPVEEIPQAEPSILPENEVDPGVHG